LRFVIAGGGTGGHLFPALAVGEVLLERGHEVVIFISEKDVDTLATRDRTEFRFEKLPSIGLPKLFSPAMLGFLKRFNDSLAPCRRLYRKFQPHAVLGMGGFTSTAPILAGRMRKIPTFVHESNAIPGKANRLNARMTDKVLLGFEDCARYFPNARFQVTGTPIRKSLMKRVPRAEALAAFGLSVERRTLLIMGGSQGAHGINEAAIKALPMLKELPLQVIHLTGPNDEQVAAANYRREEIPAHVAAFCHQMELAYSAADLALSRSGAASLSELSHFGIPSLLIPYPFAAENHQVLNAAIFAREGAAIVVEQGQVSVDTFAREIGALLRDAERLGKMSRSARKLAPDDAAQCVADTVEHAAEARAGGQNGAPTAPGKEGGER
jgi:UDP-N-acetylglucosamine--N-acetylmuramyl-(pentapeptide) pyrophosphoryl-undecaprenol N-acetylglucosamine transferase